MSRTTIRELDGIASRVAQAVGREYVPYADRQRFYSASEGAWVLDNAPQYGGWTIRERSGSGESEPIGARRRSAGAMWDALYVALGVLGARVDRAPR